MGKLKWKMWRSGFDPTEDIDQAYFVYIENEEVYDDFYDFYADYYETIRGIEGVDMWVWSTTADIYLNYEDCAHVVDDMDRFKQDTQFWEELK